MIPELFNVYEKTGNKLVNTGRSFSHRPAAKEFARVESLERGICVVTFRGKVVAKFRAGKEVAS